MCRSRRRSKRLPKAFAGSRLGPAAHTGRPSARRARAACAARSVDRNPDRNRPEASPKDRLLPSALELTSQADARDDRDAGLIRPLAEVVVVAEPFDRGVVVDVLNVEVAR